MRCAKPIWTLPILVNVVLIYGWNNSDTDTTNDRTRDKTLQDTGSGATFVWNREHVFPKSLANPPLVTSSAGAGTDAHNLRPADRSRNTSRSNRKFADGSGTASYITTGGDWYPGDEWKGDVARMMMYMYLRYGSQTLPTDVGVGTTVAADPNMILLFLEWNAEDPVSDLEKQRNPVLETLQGNRNPFIDNPAFATQIWGGPQAEDLFSGGGSGNTNELFFSEYVEGSSNNKALEIANFTGSSVDLSSYDIRKQTNGSGSWGSVYALSGTLADGDVFVIANSSAVASVTSIADVTTGSGVVTFNGNDPMALFKNGVLVDVIGTFNDTSNFAQNTTLRRKSSVNEPNTTYTISEWDTYATGYLW